MMLDAGRAVHPKRIPLFALEAVGKRSENAADPEPPSLWLPVLASPFLASSVASTAGDGAAIGIALGRAGRSVSATTTEAKSPLLILQSSTLGHSPREQHRLKDWQPDVALSGLLWRTHLA
jgi:hypothetical protein